MLYLEEFLLPGEDREWKFRNELKRTCYNTIYPFFVFPEKGLVQLRFSPVTMLYGGNGSGKSTLLNIICESLNISRGALYNRSAFFDDFANMCHAEIRRPIPKNSRLITSDDVFDFMLNLRAINDGIDIKREEMFEHYNRVKHESFRLRSMDDYEQLRDVVSARSKTQSAYVRENSQANVRNHSNGESAYLYFTETIKEDGLYLLDEPENSLSPEKQLELVQYIEDSARFYNCQFIIATHSPFLLAMRGAEIYDMDQNPVRKRRWTELKNVRLYYDFFMKNRAAFDDLSEDDED